MADTRKPTQPVTQMSIYVTYDTWKKVLPGHYRGTTAQATQIHYKHINLGTVPNPPFHRGRWLKERWSESRYFMSDEFRRLLVGEIPFF